MSESIQAAPVVPRHRARELTVQALYQWQMTGYDVETIFNQFQEDGCEEPANTLFRTLLFGVIEAVARVDAALTPLMSREMARVDPVEASVLRLAAFELMYCPDVPYRVVINEALDLEHTFGATDAHKFVNGVLDKLAKRYRLEEMAHPAKRAAGKGHGSNRDRTN